MVTNKQKKSFQGFTLIELLVVIGITGLLATTVTTVMSQVRGKARDVHRVQNVQEIAKALELYKADYGSYPVGVVPLTTFPGLVPNYLGYLPAAPDPAGAGCEYDSFYHIYPPNSYRYISYNGSSYGILFCIGNQVGDLVPGVYVRQDKGFSLKWDVNKDKLIDDNDVVTLRTCLQIHGSSNTWVSPNQEPPECRLELVDVSENAFFSNSDIIRMRQYLTIGK
jgi:prepilin-type N-terminal cleavage/methylation domain-containing protein